MTEQMEPAAAPVEFLEPGAGRTTEQVTKLLDNGAKSATGSAVVNVLESVWAAIRKAHPELPEVVIVTGSAYIGPARWGHFRAAGWSGPDDLHLGEMFLAGETLAKGAEHTLETMLHEAAHVLAKARGIQDTSRQGRWHNMKFLNAAVELGLQHKGGARDPGVGFSEVLLTEVTKTKYAALLAELDAAIRMVINLPAGMDSGTRGGEHMGAGGRRKRPEGSPSTSGLMVTCGCEKPRRFRIAPSVMALGLITCGVCFEEFSAAE
jgi:hypothetical protein